MQFPHEELYHLDQQMSSVQLERVFRFRARPDRSAIAKEIPYNNHII